MAYVDLNNGLSGLGVFRFGTDIINKVKSLVAPPVTTVAPVVTMPRYIAPEVRKPSVPTAIRVEDLQIKRPIPLTFRPTLYPPPLTLQIKTPGGADYKTTQVEVKSGPDIHAPMTGQSISLKETDSIIPLSATKEGIRITDEREPTVPTFVEAAAVEPSPWMKYGLLAIGGYILYDSFVKSKPKRRKRRRRR